MLQADLKAITVVSRANSFKEELQRCSELEELLIYSGYIANYIAKDRTTEWHFPLRDLNQVTKTSPTE